MTFLARLTELLEKINKGEHADSFELTVHLVNHAEAIRDLVVACDSAMADSSRTRALSRIFEALAKLEEA